MGGWAWVFWSVAGVLGLGALVVLAWAVVWDRSRGRKRCPRCWYDMDAVPGLVCPECGREAKGEAALRRTRRRWGGVAAACALGVLAWGSWVTPRVVREGWAGAAPLWALYAAAPLFESQGEALYQTAVAAPAPNMFAFGALPNAAAPLRAPAPAPAPGTMPTRWERVLLAIACEEHIVNQTGPTGGWNTIGTQGVLARITGQGPEAMPVVLRMLRSTESERARRVAAEVLRSCHKGQFRRVVRALERAYPAEGSSAARIAMLRTLVGLHENRPEAIPYLVELLRQPEEEAVVMACLSLGQMGEEAAPAAGAVLEVACSRRSRPALIAVATLRRIGQAAVPQLAAVVHRAPDVEAQRAAADYLAAPWSGVDVVAGELMAALADPDADVREFVTIALGRCYGHRDEVFPRLRDHLGIEGVAAVRVQCVISIARVGDAGAEVVETLARALADESDRVRYAAAMRLADFGERAAAAEPALAAALDDPSEKVRKEAARALVAIRGDGGG